jgi:hypothetical protein
MSNMPPNYQLERTVEQRGPRLVAALGPRAAFN